MQKILLAYDGGEPAKRALDMTIELATKTGAHVGVISVVPVHPGRVPIDPWDDRTVHAEELIEARKLLHERALELEQDADAPLEVRAGHAFRAGEPVSARVISWLVPTGLPPNREP